MKSTIINRQSSILLALVFVALPARAQDDDPREPGTEKIKVIASSRKDAVTYEKDIDPIFRAKCSVCHSGNVKEAGLDLGSYEGLMAGGKRGKPVVAGKADQSLLYTMSGKVKKPFMPPKKEKPLAPEELALIKLWIDQGAKAPTGALVRPKVVVGLPPAGVQPVRGIAVSPDKASVVASRGNQIHVYEAASGKHVRTLLDPKLAAPGGKQVQAAHLSLVESIAWSPDGKLIASGSYQEFALWDAQTGQLKLKVNGLNDNVVALTFSKDSKTLATGGGAPTEDGEVKLFDAATGKMTLEIKNAHSDTVFGVSFSPDGTKLATCSADKFVKTWELPSGKFVKSFEGHTHHVMDVGWKSDGKFLASAGADNVVKVWDFEKGEQARTIQAHGKQVTRLLFIGTTPQFVTCSGDTQVRVWNADNGGNTRNFGGSTDFLYAIGVSPDGSVVAAGGEEGVVRLYNGTNGQLIKALLPPDAEVKKDEPKK